MSLVNATYLVNSIKGTENFVVNLPDNYQFAAGERLITRQITQEQYDLLKEDKYKQLKIYRYVDLTNIYTDKTIAPKGLDYKIGLTVRLHNKPTLQPNGFLTKMEYFANATFNPAIMDWNYSDKILEADMAYNVDPATEYVVSRTKVLTWYQEDDTPHIDKKVMFKPYTLLEMDEEAIRRRSNVISLIKIEIAKFNSWVLIQQFPNPATRPNSNNQVKAFAALFAAPMLGYINGGDRSIIAFAQALQHPLMELRIPWHENKTVREFIISRIS